MSATPEAALERLFVATGEAPERFVALVGAFRSNAADAVRQLRVAADARDLERVARLAHRLKGSSPLYGALELAAGAQQVEDEARRGEDPGPSLDSLAQALDLAEDRIERMVTRLTQGDH